MLENEISKSIFEVYSVPLKARFSQKMPDAGCRIESDTTSNPG
jgi:hypothetical protein